MGAKNTVRFIKLDAKGKKLAASAKTWSAVEDTKTKLIWDLAVAGPINHAAALKHCADLRLLGKSDWRLPERLELESLLDLTRFDPAIDTDVFPNTPSRWFWTATAYAPGSGDAWIVTFSYGDSHHDPHGYSACVRAVRASQ